MIIGFGAMLGKLMMDSGAAQRISMTLIERFGRTHIKWAICVISFLMGIVLFYEVGFVMILPIIVTIAITAKIPLLDLGIPMAASLSVAHAFLPPHPGATAVAILLGADIGLTLLYGIIVGIPIVIVAGPLFAKLPVVQRIKAEVPKGLFTPRTFAEEDMPGFKLSMVTALLPIALIALASIAKLTLPADSSIVRTLGLIGNPEMALLIGVLLAVYTFGLRRGSSMTEVMKQVEDSVAPVCMIMLVIGAGASNFGLVNDPGFWMFKEFFGLTVKECVITYCSLNTLIGVVGIIAVLGLNMIIA